MGASNFKQIRVLIEKNAYERMKNKAKSLRMTLEHYCGLYLSGYRVEKIE